MAQVLPDLQLLGRAAWRAWLAENHATQPGVWLVLNKKNATGLGVTYEDAVQEALCFGWIDGQTKSRDGDTFLQRMSPRRKGSIWSESNKRRVEKLSAAGLMTEPGLARVREAHENGEWEAATLREDTSTLPDDLQAALATNEQAARGFASFTVSYRRQLLYLIGTAKTPSTRQRRIAGVVRQAQEYEPKPARGNKPPRATGNDGTSPDTTVPGVID